MTYGPETEALESHESSPSTEAPYPDDIESRLTRLESKVDKIMDLIAKADSTISKIAEQVMPTIEDLMKSPLLKMLGMKK